MTPRLAMGLLAEVATGRILTGVGLLVIEVLDKSVVSSSKRTAKERADPVDPVVTGERCASDGRTEAARGVEGAACVVHTYYLVSTSFDCDSFSR